MADDGPAVDAALISNRLVPGEALVGFAVAEGKQGSIGCPDRAGELAIYSLAISSNRIQ